MNEGFDAMIPAPVRTEILRRIAAAQAEHQARFLLAIESGCRAWGFESPNSDFDVRFNYEHERAWYLSIDDRRDVIEYPHHGRHRLERVGILRRRDTFPDHLWGA